MLQDRSSGGIVGVCGDRRRARPRSSAVRARSPTLWRSPFSIAPPSIPRRAACLIAAAAPSSHLQALTFGWRVVKWREMSHTTSTRRLNNSSFPRARLRAQKRIRDVARRDNLSLNQAAIALLRQGAGLSSHAHRDVVGDSLDQFFGIWTKEEADQFDEFMKDFRSIDTVSLAVNLLLDTNVYSAFLRGKAEATELIRSASSIYMSVFVVGELLEGFRRGARAAENSRILQSFLAAPRVRFVPATIVTADRYSRVLSALRANSRRFQPTTSGSPRMPWRWAPISSPTTATSARSTGWPGSCRASRHDRSGTV